MLPCDIALRFLEEAYIGKNYSYVEKHISDDYVCHCSSGTINKAQAINLLKRYLKKHPVKKLYSTVDFSDEETITLNILFECKEKEKFLGFTVGETDRYYRHIKTFKVKDGVITESWDETSEIYE